MNPEIKAKWIEALRSGKYLQARARLRKNGGHCCLGVLCDLIDSTEWQQKDGLFIYDGFAETIPPGRILNAAKLPDGEACHLADMNDGGKSFREIADYIEQNL